MSLNSTSWLPVPRIPNTFHVSRMAQFFIGSTPARISGASLANFVSPFSTTTPAAINQEACVHPLTYVPRPE